MTALRIWRSANPSAIGAPLLPMCPEQARFWRLRRDRSAASTKATATPAAFVGATGREVGA